MSASGHVYAKRLYHNIYKARVHHPTIPTYKCWTSNAVKCTVHLDVLPSFHSFETTVRLHNAIQPILFNANSIPISIW